MPGRLAPAVSFHQVVHPVLAEEAGVAVLQRFSGGPGERGQECPAHAARERIVRQVASGQTPEAVAEAQASSRGRFASGLIVIAAKDWQVCRIARPGNVLEHSHKPAQTIILSRC
jgi:hypothetical protein